MSRPKGKIGPYLFFCGWERTNMTPLGCWSELWSCESHETYTVWASCHAVSKIRISSRFVISQYKWLYQICSESWAGLASGWKESFPLRTVCPVMSWHACPGLEIDALPGRLERNGLTLKNVINPPIFSPYWPGKCKLHFSPPLLKGWGSASRIEGRSHRVLPVLRPYIYWVVVSNIFYFHPYLGKVTISTNIRRGWNHQLVYSGTPERFEKFFVSSLFCAASFQKAQSWRVEINPDGADAEIALQSHGKAVPSIGCPVLHCSFSLGDAWARDSDIPDRGHWTPSFTSHPTAPATTQHSTGQHSNHHHNPHDNHHTNHHDNHHDNHHTNHHDNHHTNHHDNHHDNHHTNHDDNHNHTNHHDNYHDNHHDDHHDNHHDDHHDNYHDNYHDNHHDNPHDNHQTTTQGATTPDHTGRHATPHRTTRATTPHHSTPATTQHQWRWNLTALSLVHCRKSQSGRTNQNIDPSGNKRWYAPPSVFHCRWSKWW